MNLFLAFDFTNFVGRFHPILVHLPIGFLLLALLMEWYQRRNKKEKINGLITFAWLLGAIGGAFAAFCGWYLGETGLYFEDTLALHRWLGIGIVLFSFVGWWIKKNAQRYSKVLHIGINLSLLALLLFEGHLGGNLTHGASYLFEYAPAPVRNLMLDENETAIDLSLQDSVMAYQDLIKPVFEQKCVACHNDEVQRGGLNMASTDSLLLGGENSPAFLAGNAADSELFKRITLPQGNIKFMPPVGNPLTYDEIKLVEWWIASGASFAHTISEVEVNSSIKSILLRNFNLDTEPKPWYETVKINPLDNLPIKKMRMNGFTVKSLGANNPLLDVNYTGDTLTLTKFGALDAAFDHITWLSFAETNIDASLFSTISKFSNLTRLRLEKTNVTDKDIASLAGLVHLESLNLYGTQVTDACLPYLKEMESLERVYLWQTNVTAKGAKALSEEVSGLEVVIGVN